MNNGIDIHWGIIGCGAVTEKKSGPAYQKVANFELAAVMRRNRALAQDFARRHNIENTILMPMSLLMIKLLMLSI